MISKVASLFPKAGHSGYPIFSGRVIRVIKSATRFLPQKNTTRKFGYPIIRVRVLPDIPKFMENNQLH
jgi:hypothetical protein